MNKLLATTFLILASGALRAACPNLEGVYEVNLQGARLTSRINESAVAPGTCLYKGRKENAYEIDANPFRVWVNYDGWYVSNKNPEDVRPGTQRLALISKGESNCVYSNVVLGNLSLAQAKEQLRAGTFAGNRPSFSLEQHRATSANTYELNPEGRSVRTRDEDSDVTKMRQELLRVLPDGSIFTRDIERSHGRVHFAFFRHDNEVACLFRRVEN